MGLSSTLNPSHYAIIRALESADWLSVVQLAQRIQRHDTYTRKMCAQLVKWGKIDLQQRLIQSDQAGKLVTNWYRIGTGQRELLRAMRGNGKNTHTLSNGNEKIVLKQPQHGGRVVQLTDTRRWEWGGQAVKLGGSREYAMEVMW